MQPLEEDRDWTGFSVPIFLIGITAQLSVIVLMADIIAVSGYIWICWETGPTLKNICLGAFGLVPVAGIVSWWATAQLTYMLRAVYWARHMKMDAIGLVVFDRAIEWNDIEQIVKARQSCLPVPADDVLILTNGERISLPLVGNGRSQIRAALERSQGNSVDAMPGS